MFVPLQIGPGHFQTAGAGWADILDRETRMKDKNHITTGRLGS